MNINLENFNLSNNICSVKVKVINDDNIFETIKMFDSSTIALDIEFKNDCDYIVIISVAQFGRQVLKRKYSFNYHICDEYKLDDNVTIVNNIKSNEIKIKKIISNYNYNFDINPLASFREENNLISVFANGNIYLLKGNLKKIFLDIVDKISFDKITLKEDEIIKGLELLILKGCVVCYE